ncbi:hypothetical protein BDZ89DRAFT_1146341 [Hymenopellis radicata]|nr:hypothetical protein BDZ89DRAFT_1146341 [Hymenopellis radicata]
MDAGAVAQAAPSVTMILTDLDFIAQFGPASTIVFTSGGTRCLEPPRRRLLIQDDGRDSHTASLRVYERLQVSNLINLFVYHWLNRSSASDYQVQVWPSSMRAAGTQASTPSSILEPPLLLSRCNFDLTFNSHCRFEPRRTFPVIGSLSPEAIREFEEDHDVEPLLDDPSQCNFLGRRRPEDSAPQKPGTATDPDWETETADPATKDTNRTNKVNAEAFQGTTGDTLRKARQAGTTSTSPDGKTYHSKSWRSYKSSAFANAPQNSFREASKNREEQRRASCEKAGISIPEDSEKGKEKEKEKRKPFDPAEARVMDHLKDKTGRAPKHVRKKKAPEPEPAHDNWIPVEFVLLPETAKVHCGSFPRPNKIMFETLSRPENNYTHKIQLRETSNAEEVDAAIMEAFAEVVAVIPEADDAEEPTTRKIGDLFHICDVVAPEKSGASSKLRPNEWLQNGQASFAYLKLAFKRAQPSGITVSEMPICVYLCMCKEFEDLPFNNPNAKVPKAPKENEPKRRSRKRKPSRSPSPTRSSPRNKKAKTDELEKMKESPVPPKKKRQRDDEEEVPPPKKSKGPDVQGSVKVLTTPPELARIIRKSLNTSSAYIGRHFGGGYGGSGKWYANNVTQPYDKLVFLIGHLKGMHNLVRDSESLKSNPALAEELLTTDYAYLEAFTPFNDLVKKVRQHSDLPAERNIEFVRLFKTGPHGFNLAVDALSHLSAIAIRISQMSGLTRRSSFELAAVLDNVALCADNLSILMDYFMSNVSGAYWYPLGGYRQLAAIVNFNQPLIREHLPRGEHHSYLHNSLCRLQDLLTSDTIPACAITDHLEENFGHATDPARMRIDILQHGQFGLELLLKILHHFLINLPINAQYDAKFKVLGDFCMAVAWKVCNVLKRPRFYNQTRPRNVSSSEAKLNASTGNEEPVDSCDNFDSVLEKCPDGPDERWYMELIVPNTAAFRAFMFPSSIPSSPPAGNRHSPLPMDADMAPTTRQPATSELVDPRLVRASVFAAEIMPWDILLMRLKTEFPHPVRDIRNKFIKDAAVGLSKKKQWVASQLTYHPDKNSDNSIHQGSIWEQICTQLNSAINRAYERGF